MVDLSNMFHSYVSLPEDNIMISIDQWDFQDPIDGGTLASTIFQAKKKLWGHSLKFRPFKKGLIYGIGTSNQSVPEIPIDCAIRHDGGSPQGVVASFQSAGHVRCQWKLTIFGAEKMTTVLLILWLYLRCKPGMVWRALGAMSKTCKMASSSRPIEAENR